MTFSADPMPRRGLLLPGGGALIAIQRFNTHQTLIPIFDDRTTAIFIRLLGAGAGGGSVSAPAAGQVCVGNGGGGGAFLEKLIRGRDKFVGKPLVIGMAGVGGAAGGAPHNGADGGATTFDAAGANYSAGGGLGSSGNGVAAPGWIVVSARGGTAVNGDLNLTGPPCVIMTFGSVVGNAYGAGGAPAAPEYGIPGFSNSIFSTAAVQGGDASGNGAGGAGAIAYNGNTPLRGGNGSDGWAEMWELG